MSSQRQYWTDKGKDKTFTTPFQAEVFARHVDKDARILDFGCGYGRVTSELHSFGYKNVTGIDFSESLIERGKAEHPGLDLRSYSGGPLPFKDASFDAALMLGVFTCIPATKDQAHALIEVKRVLKPGGLLYVNDFLLNRDKRNLDRYKSGQEKHGVYGTFEVEDGGILRHHDRAHMEALLTDFETILFEETVYNTMHGHKSNGFYCMARKA